VNKKLNKFLVYLLVLSTIISWAGPSFAKSISMPYIIHEEMVESQYLGSGIKYEHIRKLTASGWWNINLVRVDLDDEYAEVKGLMNSKGLSSTSTVSNLVNTNRAVAGVNGDYFEFKPLPHPMGTYIEDGKVISSPIERAYALPTFYITEDNKPGIEFFDRSFKLKSLDSGETLDISLINKSADFNMVTLLNKNWGQKSFGNRFNEDTIEMVVVDNIVEEIRVGQPPIDIPDNGYVITVSGERGETILNNFEVGHEVELITNTTPNLESIKFAIGGGSIILKNGVPTNSNINIKGNQPRTGIGISQDEKELIIATIDGRNNSFVGVSQELFGLILKDLGAYNAINLDGGGSTTMAVKPVDKQVAEVVNKPSDGSQRKVPNGVGVFSNAPQGELSYIKVSADDKNVFTDTSRKFSIKGYDQYHHPIEVNQNAVEYSVAGVDGEFIGNTLKAKSQGKAKITANYNGITANTEIKVLGPVKNIILPINNFNIKSGGNKNLGSYTGVDNNGFKAKIYPEDINFTVINDLGHVENNVFYSNGKEGSGAISLSVGNAVNNILVSIGGEEKAIESFENLDTLKSSTYPDYVQGSIALSQDAKVGNNSGKIVYDFSKGDVNRAVYMELHPNDELGLKLENNPSRLGLWVKGDGQGSWLRGHIVDKNKKAYSIDFVKNLNSTEWEYVEASIPENVAYPITLEKIYVVETDVNKKHSGEVLIDGLTAIQPRKYDNTNVPDSSSSKDIKNVKTEKKENGFSFIVTKAPNNLNEIADFDAKTTIANKVNSHNVALFMGDTDTEFMKELNPQLKMNTGINYVRKTYGNVMFIDANNSKGGIRATNPEQWKWLKGGLENSKEDHIVMMLPSPVFGNGGFKDPLERDLLHNLLADEAEAGKTVWVIHGGSSNKTEVKEGVRYIEYDNRNVSNPDEVKNIQAIEFIVNGKDINYQINPVFN